MIDYVELRLHSGSSTSLLPDFTTTSFDIKYNDLGVIEFGYPVDKAAALGLKDQSIVSVTLGYSDGTSAEIERYVIEGTNDQKVSDSARIETFSGRSVLALLNDAVVYPSNWPVTSPSGHEFVDMTIGTIMRTLLLRARNRGTLTNVTDTSFSGTADSKGAVWSHLHTQNYSTGIGYYNLISEFTQRGLADVWMTNALDLQIVNGGTRGSHIGLDVLEIRPAHNVTEMVTATQSADSISTVLIEGEAGTSVERTDTNFQSALGRRRERFVSQGGITDAGVLSILGDAELSLYARIPTEETVGISNSSSLIPFKHFTVADWVNVRFSTDTAPVERRVWQLAVNVSQSREVSLGCTLNTILYENDVALARRVEAYTGSGGTYGSVPNTGVDNTVPNPPNGLGVTSTAFVRADGTIESVMSVSWVPPSTNVGGSAYTDPGGFEVQWRYTGGDWSAINPVTASPFGLGGLRPGAGVEVWVRTVDSTGHPSNWATTTHTLAFDVTPPPKPAAPSGVSRLGNVLISWSGLTATGAAQPTDFAYAEVHRSTNSSFVPTLGSGTRVGSIERGGSMVLTNLAYGGSNFFKIIAVDNSGNASTPSDASNEVIVVSLVNTDLIGQVIDGATNIVPGSVGTGALSSGVNASLTAANGKNKITYSLSDASGTTGFTAGDTWFKRASAAADAAIIGQWEFDGTAWVSRTIGNQVIAYLDAAKITTGFLDTARIQTGSILIGQVGGLYSELNSLYSMGTDLIVNGTGSMGDNTNFTAFTANGVDVPTGASKSFYASLTTAHAPTVDNLIPFDPVKDYAFTFKARQTVPGATNRFYGFIAPYDQFGNVIGPQNYMFQANTTTTLAAPLNNGDTTITLTSAANWYGSAAKPAGGNTHWRSIIWWDWTDPNGKVWPQHTYSRRPWAANLWADGGVSGNVITLNAPWSGGSFSAGTPLSNGSSGGSYVYMATCSNVVVPETWTTYQDVYTAGVMPPATAASGRSSAVWSSGLPEATSQIKVGWLVNYPASPANATVGRHAIASVSFSDATAARIAADNSANTAVESVKTLWGHPTNTTLIDGGNIYTNTIRAESLTLSDWTNYVADGMLTDPSHANWQNTTRTAPSGTTPGYLSWTGGNGTNAHIYNRHMSEVAPLDEFYFECEVSTPASNTANISVTPSMATYQSDATTIVTWPQVSPTVLTPNTGWTLLSGVITIPVGNSAFGAWGPFANGAAAGQIVRMRKMVLRKKAKGSLIVDGQITGTHIAGLTIAAGNMAANSITSEKVVAGAISADKLTIGGLGPAYNRNANMEDSGPTWPAGWRVVYSNNGTTTLGYASTPISGTKSLRVTGSTATINPTVFMDANTPTANASWIPVAAGQKWYVKADVRPGQQMPNGTQVSVSLCTSATPSYPTGIFDSNVVWQTVTLTSNGTATYGSGVLLPPLEGIFTVPANHTLGGVSVSFSGNQGVSTPYFDFDNIEMKPAVTNGQVTEISGNKITTGLLQANVKIVAGAQQDTGARVEMRADGLYSYNSSNVNTFTLRASDGAAYFSGSITSGSTITGTTITGSTVTAGDTGGTFISIGGYTNVWNSGISQGIIKFGVAGGGWGDGQIHSQYFTEGGANWAALRLTSPYEASGGFPTAPFLDLRQNNFGGSKFYLKAAEANFTANTFIVGDGTTTTDFRSNGSGFQFSDYSALSRLRLLPQIGYFTVRSQNDTGATQEIRLQGNQVALSFEGQELYAHIGGNTAWPCFHHYQRNVGFSWGTDRVRVTTWNDDFWMPISASAFTVSSDPRLKENASPAKGALSAVRALTVYDYDMQGVLPRQSPQNPLTETVEAPQGPRPRNRVEQRKVTSERARGVMADELQKVLPDAVNADEMGNLSVSLYDLLSTALAAIKELAVEVDSLKEK